MRPSTENSTVVKEFVLVGFSGLCEEARLTLFCLFLTMYLLTLAENGVLVLVVAAERHLHVPMYFFLVHLSCLDVGYTSLTMPKMLAGLVGPPSSRVISHPACLAQLYLFTALGATECFLLAAMAYDRYVAICMPLRYQAVMSWATCLWLAGGSWVAGFLVPALPIYLMAQLTFCSSNTVNHFFCDASPLLVLSCSDISIKQIGDFLVSLAVLLASSLVIGASYTHIIIAVMQIRSAAGRERAFSTCTAHLAVVSTFYGTLFFMYARTEVASSIHLNKAVSVFYASVTPMLNPLIYSLRNVEVKSALNRAFSQGTWRPV